MIGPKFEAMAEEFEAATFVKVDVDDASQIASNCGISSIPTYQFYKDGSKIDSFSGANEAKLRETIQKHL